MTPGAAGCLPNAAARDDGATGRDAARRNYSTLRAALN